MTVSVRAVVGRCGRRCSELASKAVEKNTEDTSGSLAVEWRQQGFIWGNGVGVEGWSQTQETEFSGVQDYNSTSVYSIECSLPELSFLPLPYI